METKTHPTETVARAYLTAVGNKDLTRLKALLAPDISFVGPVMTISGAPGVLEALKRIGAIHVRNDIQRVFVDGDEACVIYDFVTDTVGSVPTIEWLRIEDGRVRSVKLYYDQLPWQVLRRELEARASRASA